MGKTHRRRQSRKAKMASHECTVFIPLDEIYVSDSTMEKLLKRDFGQIKQMRMDIEDGKEIVRVVLRNRCGGGYNIEDGRHRVIAAKLASAGVIEALIVGR